MNVGVSGKETSIFMDSLWNLTDANSCFVSGRKKVKFILQGLTLMLNMSVPGLVRS